MKKYIIFISFALLLIISYLFILNNIKITQLYTEFNEINKVITRQMKYCKQQEKEIKSLVTHQIIRKNKIRLLNKKWGIIQKPNLIISKHTCD